MIAIEERLRHSASIYPNFTIDVYPGDVLEVLDAAIAERDRAVAQRDYMKTLKDAAIEQLAIARSERDALRADVSELRTIAQNALDHGGDRELVYAPLYQRALEDIASEPQDEDE